MIATEIDKRFSHDREVIIAMATRTRSLQVEPTRRKRRTRFSMENHFDNGAHS